MMELQPKSLKYRTTENGLLQRLMLVRLELIFGKIIQMKNWFLFLMLPLLGFSQVKKDTIKVYFLGGQSNMQGYGFNKDLPNDLINKFDNVYIFHGNNVEDNKPNAGFGIWDKLQPGHGTEFSSDGKTNKLSDRFGIELSFTNEILKNKKQKIAIIKYSRNGSSIDIDGAPYFGTWTDKKKLKTDESEFPPEIEVDALNIPQHFKNSINNITILNPFRRIRCVEKILICDSDFVLLQGKRNFIEKIYLVTNLL